MVVVHFSSCLFDVVHIVKVFIQYILLSLLWYYFYLKKRLDRPDARTSYMWNSFSHGKLYKSQEFWWSMYCNNEMRIQYREGNILSGVKAYYYLSQFLCFCLLLYMMTGCRDNFRIFVVFMSDCCLVRVIWTLRWFCSCF